MHRATRSGQFACAGLLAAVVGLFAQDASAAPLGPVYYEWVGSPGATATLTETAPLSGTFKFFDDYIWTTTNDPAQRELDGAVLGPWAASTQSYSMYQRTDVRNTIALEGVYDRVIYTFAVPLAPNTEVASILVSAGNLRGPITARTRNTEVALNDPYSSALFVGTSTGTDYSGFVDLSDLDLVSLPGYALFEFKFQMESPGGFGWVDSLDITATTQAIPEPTSMAALGLAATALLARRRRA